MFHRFVSGKFIYFKLFVVFAVPCYGIEVKHATSSVEMLNSFIDYYDKNMELKEYCSQAKLTILLHVNSKMYTINMSIILKDPKFKCCFSYFHAVLKRKKKDIASVKIPFNCNVDKAANYIFGNITCGLYEFRIRPCFNNWQCAYSIFIHQEPINMTCIDYNGVLSSSTQFREKDFQMEIIAIMTVGTILLMFSIGGFVYCHNSIVIKKRKKEKENIKLLEKKLEKQEGNFKKIEVYILHYSNETIMRNVEMLKDFLLKLPNIHVVLIKDELHKILLNRTWWINNVLEKSDEKDHTLKKVIIVDADKNKNGESVDDIENENENQTFNEVITILNQNWLSSLNDYYRIFVIRFNGLSPSRAKVLEFVVPGVRYDIPGNQLLTLCKVLLSGSGFDSCYEEEDLKELIKCHPIKNLSSIETEYNHV